MKTKLIQVITLITILSLLGPNLVLGQDTQIEPQTAVTESFLGCNPNDGILQCLKDIAGYIFKIILYIAVVLAVIFFVLAGITYITKGKEEEGRKKAQNQIIYASIGLVVALISYFLVQFLAKSITKTQ
jgi:undecaprenyl pyrophosphate phosphatase UppP